MNRELLELTLILRKKYNKFNEILDITKQLQEVVNRNDMESVKIIMRMRRDAMLEVEEIDYKITHMKDSMSPTALEEAKRQMSMDFTKTTEKKSMEKIHEDEKLREVYLALNKTIQRVIAIDDILSAKINKGTKIKPKTV